MSGQSTGWVFEHSPFNGATFQVHLAIGDSANDQHDYEIWLRVPELATKARVSEASVNRALDALVDADFLEELDEVTPTAGRPARRFRMLFPDTPAVWVPRRKKGSGKKLPLTTKAVPLTEGDLPLTTTGLSRTVRGSNIKEVEPKRTQVDPNANGRSLAVVADSHDLPFETFWNAYPRRTQKPAARQAWTRAIRRALDVTIIQGAQRYAHDPNREDRYTPYPAKWLDGDCWNDPPIPSRSATPKGLAAIQRAVEAQR